MEVELILRRGMGGSMNSPSLIHGTSMDSPSLHPQSSMHSPSLGPGMSIDSPVMTPKSTRHGHKPTISIELDPIVSSALVGKSKQTPIYHKSKRSSASGITPFSNDTPATIPEGQATPSTHKFIRGGHGHGTPKPHYGSRRTSRNTPLVGSGRTSTPIVQHMSHGSARTSLLAADEIAQLRNDADSSDDNNDDNDFNDDTISMPSQISREMIEAKAKTMAKKRKPKRNSFSVARSKQNQFNESKQGIDHDHDIEHSVTKPNAKTGALKDNWGSLTDFPEYDPNHEFDFSSVDMTQFQKKRHNIININNNINDDDEDIHDDLHDDSAFPDIHDIKHD
eukprot:CAMPEP_0114664654 /NCGR_PEP_ID=MMETSP0191-20121206/29207_1 /TAXON_ID=126664 /ORGANISM="Sorites sp." /LENGTH=335 /DNA_ID=CAMNT_0001907379 /DNA_START=95 /DNA_END=1099 /DNA_ORIENTATION=+